MSDVFICQAGLSDSSLAGSAHGISCCVSSCGRDESTCDDVSHVFSERG